MTTANPPLLGAGSTVLESLYQHRLLTSGQIQRMNAPDRGTRSTRKIMSSLHQHGLVDRVRVPRGDGNVYFLTPAGARAVEGTAAADSALRLMSVEQAAGPLTAHTLAVNETGIAFMKAARTQADEFGALAWRHEIAHPLGSRRREKLISDALLSYLQYPKKGEPFLHQRLLELDRATLPADRLAQKLARYARLYRYTPTGRDTPAWQTRYREFPPVLCILAGSSDPVLQRRLETLTALCEQQHELTDTPEVEIYITLLSTLTREGPFAAIWQRADLPERVDWLAQPANHDESKPR
jgi:Replication-relaxation